MKNTSRLLVVPVVDELLQAGVLRPARHSLVQLDSAALVDHGGFDERLDVELSGHDVTSSRTVLRVAVV